MEKPGSFVTNERNLFFALCLKAAADNLRKIAFGTLRNATSIVIVHCRDIKFCFIFFFFSYFLFINFFLLRTLRIATAQATSAYSPQIHCSFASYIIYKCIINLYSRCAHAENCKNSRQRRSLVCFYSRHVYSLSFFRASFSPSQKVYIKRSEIM